ncbi:DNA-binding protein [Paenibacillus nuruki]|uniref:DNA-binding protein n=1 Tax=Paenibacillus nuruki TaxID=1886670 RepID=UPI002805CD19|nr:DNA-binding protein [Paenibacillus nuruki]CAJ1317690.1 DNA-binding protein [Paenibacillus nuruki]
MITNTTTIRLEIEKGIRQKGHSLSSFGKQAGINRGIISGILNGNPPKSISIRQLDLMAEALGHAEGWMYEYYVDECFINEKADWRRIKAFLLRCTEIGRYDCIKEVLDRLMEDLNNTISIFGLAEELYAEGKVQESLPFYECVIENEKHQHSERLAISHYRVFRASIGENTEKSFRSAIRFEPYRNRLPENLMLDALLQLANVYYTLQDWKTMEYCADELKLLLEQVYKIDPHYPEKIIAPKETERHIVVYYGQSFLLKSVALESLGKYLDAKSYISGYADLSWFPDLDSVGQKEVDKFKLAAIANKHNLDLLMGDDSNLDEYVNFLQRHPNEILPSIIVILEAANKYNFDIKNTLKTFSISFDSEINFQNDYYQKSTYKSRLVTFYYELALYFLIRELHNDGIKYVLKSLEMALEIVNKNKVLDCVSLFEQFKAFSTDNQKEFYENLIRGVNNDAKIHIVAKSSFDIN